MKHKILMILMAVSFLVCAGCLGDFSWHPFIAFISLIVFGYSTVEIRNTEEYREMLKSEYSDIDGGYYGN